MHIFQYNYKFSYLNLRIKDKELVSIHEVFIGSALGNGVVLKTWYFSIPLRVNPRIAVWFEDNRSAISWEYNRHSNLMACNSVFIIGKWVNGWFILVTNFCALGSIIDNDIPILREKLSKLHPIFWIRLQLWLFLEFCVQTTQNRNDYLKMYLQS